MGICHKGCGAPLAPRVHLPAIRCVDCAVVDVSNSSGSVIVYDTGRPDSVQRCWLQYIALRLREGERE